MRPLWPAALVTLTAACALPPEMGPAAPRLSQLPEPFRALCLLGVAADSILLPPEASAVPATRVLTGAAFRDGAVTWLGQSGFLVRLGGQSVLIDPILSDRLGTPVSPPRLAAAPDLAIAVRLSLTRLKVAGMRTASARCHVHSASSSASVAAPSTTRKCSPW